MTAMHDHVQDYLRLRRALGFKLIWPGRILPQFADYLEAAGSSTITDELAIAWAQLPTGVDPVTWTHRLGVVRGFAKYLKTIDPATQIPPKGIFPGQGKRPAPYLFSEQDIARLLEATRTLHTPLRAATCHALFGLLAVSGRRISEALALQRDNVDLDTGILTIISAKSDSPRLIPLHPTATTALREYADLRDRLRPRATATTFFISHRGTALIHGPVWQAFIQLTADIGLRTRDHQAPDSRPAPLLRRPLPAALVSQRRRCRRPDGDLVHLSRASQSGRDLLVPVGGPRADAAGSPASPGPGSGRPVMTAFAPVLQAFFTDRLMTQRQASGHTIAAYRDTFRLLLGFAADRTAKKPSSLDLADLDAPFIASFLDHLEHDRGNSIRTRNARLAAIHSLFNYAALRHPEHAASIKRVLAIPPKRYERNLLTYLTEQETDALLDACDRTTWTGRRDHAMLSLTLQTGLRVSELTSLTCSDLHLGDGPNVHCVGKGRKKRRTPLLPATVKVLRVWLTERQGQPHEPLFPTSTGRRLSRDAVERRITLYSGKAAERCPSLATKHPTAHTLRHTAAMRLLLSGVDVTVIALWLGHEQVGTAQLYLHADMNQKERAIARTTPPGTKPGRYHAPDPLLAFLEAL